MLYVNISIPSLFYYNTRSNLTEEISILGIFVPYMYDIVNAVTDDLYQKIMQKFKS